MTARVRKQTRTAAADQDTTEQQPETDREQGVTSANLPDADHPARLAELEALREERDNLRDKLDGADVDEILQLRAEVQSLKTMAARAGVIDKPKHMSEGLREEIDRVGFAVDPSTGRTLTRDDLPS